MTKEGKELLREIVKRVAALESAGAGQLHELAAQARIQSNQAGDEGFWALAARLDSTSRWLDEAIKVANMLGQDRTIG